MTIKAGDLIYFKFDPSQFAAYKARPNSLALVYRTFSPHTGMYLANVWWVTGIPAQNGESRMSTVNLNAVKKYDTDR
jgi:hypothetical protein